MFTFFIIAIAIIAIVFLAQYFYKHYFFKLEKNHISELVKENTPDNITNTNLDNNDLSSLNNHTCNFCIKELNNDDIKVTPHIVLDQNFLGSYNFLELSKKTCEWFTWWQNKQHNDNLIASHQKMFLSIQEMLNYIQQQKRIVYLDCNINAVVDDKCYTKKIENKECKTNNIKNTNTYIPDNTTRNFEMYTKPDEPVIETKTEKNSTPVKPKRKYVKRKDEGEKENQKTK
jgi:hypothetical protein